MLNDAMHKNPQAAWKIIDEMKRDAVQTDKSEKINCKEWFDHFQKRNCLHLRIVKIQMKYSNMSKMTLQNMKILIRHAF